MGDKAPGKFVVSPKFKFRMAMGLKVVFHLRCYAKYSADSSKCAIFMFVDQFPDSVKRVRIEADIQCHKKKKYGQLFQRMILSTDDRMAGFQAFDFKELERNEGI